MGLELNQLVIPTKAQQNLLVGLWVTSADDEMRWEARFDGKFDFSGKDHSRERFAGKWAT